MIISIKTTKVPKLRFPEFRGEWEEKNLGDVANFWNGLAHEKNIIEQGKYVVVNSKFVSSEGEVKKYTDTQISPLRKDDIAIVMSDIPNGKALAKCFLVDKDDVYTLNQRIGGINSDKIISTFLESILNRNKYFLRIDNGVSQTNLRRDEILKCPVLFPSIPEQQRISEFVGSVAKWIENLNKQKENLEKYKMGMMQKIFSQEIRFKDENGKEYKQWVKKKLNEIFNYKRGFGLSKDQIVREGAHKCVLYGELYTLYNEEIQEVISCTNTTTGVKSKAGDLLIPSSTTTTAIDLAHVSVLAVEGVLLGGDIIILRFKDSGDSAFYAYYLTHFKKLELAKYGQGSTIVHLYYSHFSKILIDLPEEKEQKKIAEFLTSIDKVIESKQKQIDLAESWKKGLMQVMFI